MKNEILLKVISDPYLYNTFIKSVGIFECLNDNQKAIYKKVQDFHTKTQKCPSEQEALTYFDVPLDISKIGEDFTFESILSEIRREKLKYWILDIATDIERDKVDYDKVYKELSILKDKLEVQIPKGFTVGQLVSEIVNYEVTKAKTDVIKTNIKSLDHVLKGGFHKGELAFLVAPPGRGKSTFLINLLYSFLMQKKLTVLLSNELRSEAILSRLYRRILKMPREQFSYENKKDIEDGLTRFFKFVKGKGVVHYVPVNSWSVSDMKSWISAWEKEFDQKVDAIIIDYFDRLKKPWAEDNRLKQRALVDELRDYAVDKDIFIGTATQANKASLDAPLVTEQHIGEAFAKIETADVVISLSQNTQEREQKKGRLTILKNREYGGMGSIVDVKISWEELLVADFEY